MKKKFKDENTVNYQIIIEYSAVRTGEERNRRAT